ncbi:Ribosomal RNA small subunit methyltransferase D [Providencia rustigianii]|uniref:Ribosomal RNA small subunit methyltransferase D n=2 Tax=Providencia rustigianii TaxID=158850 RepID=D1P224_9GAMM|nr:MULTISPECIES: 16S rRNA (guanine(966)-N(2))-methyltransferase [Providencia]EFB72645.1 RNA methyltransferase, RsmD family [Providencia rustigianii DSM 4541]MTC56024.1 16S rRNA (guanine(966)-N(2))-methyltransferase [Providencia rustigianii]MTC58745.1 16S rRNA (guanine(966)-N(2))-methyltransferase [Providencia rustigianii]SPY78863.1 Ribosomal RNA small subunit methyltransferase D [Providencia rustigianii]SUC28547.1 Ribosomal RNA small subunit methyltransferase D [Providencia rustigianii]
MAKKPQTASLGQIRVIGGKWRGRKLPVRDSEGLRPTTDRIKETLFNWLMPVIRDARCLDCFAGSGSLGFEALSRFANHVTFIELEKSNAQLLNENKDRLQADNATVINSNSLSFLSQNGTPYDVVFIDPPFRKGLLSETVQLLEKNQWLADESWIYVESEAELPLTDIPANWQLHREKVAGQVAYRLFIRHVI